MYNLDYFENMLRMYSKSAEEICKIRWEFIGEAKSVLDYGCGCGWFRAFRPQGVEVDSYDVMPVPQTGIANNSYDVVCLWDVLEHFENLDEIIPVLLKGKKVALTIPIKPEGVELTTWKHYKPREHFQYFTPESLDLFMKQIGFKLIKSGYLECPPRKDIMSALYEKV